MVVGTWAWYSLCLNRPGEGQAMQALSWLSVISLLLIFVFKIQSRIPAHWIVLCTSWVGLSSSVNFWKHLNRHSRRYIPRWFQVRNVLKGSGVKGLHPGVTLLGKETFRVEPSGRIQALGEMLLRGIVRLQLLLSVFCLLPMTWLWTTLLSQDGLPHHSTNLSWTETHKTES